MNVDTSCICRISRLFSDAKKILLYSQDDKNLDGFKELAQALKTLQDSTPGRKHRNGSLSVLLNSTSPESVLFTHTRNLDCCLLTQEDKKEHI